MSVKDKQQGKPQTEQENGVIVEEKVIVKRPNPYKVILLNDDYTPMEFVVHVLKAFFQKDDVTAHQIMMQVHQEGKGVAGVYPFDIAESKVVQVTNYARQNKHPLQVVIEKS